jgi:ABC-type lipoprotein export system ATPase subunit
MTLTTSPSSSTPGTADTPPLELRDVGISYQRPGSEPLVIIDHYDLAVAAGQLHCLAGRSGSGKTSILRVAAGLVPPTSGSVIWAGTQITGLADDAITARRRGSIGYLDQGGILVPGLTALENVLLPAVPQRESKKLVKRASELVHRLGVDGRANSYPEKLSGGERQRVALARALLLEPSIIMADEPTASLDRASADSVIALLRGFADTGITVIVAAHDQHLIDAADTRTTLA